jgi:hypothetical protein
MIKFRGKNEKGKDLLGIALSELNVKKLKEGMPILVDDDTFFDGQILLMYGRTEEEIVEELKDMMDMSNTEIRVDKDKQ